MGEHHDDLTISPLQLKSQLSAEERHRPDLLDVRGPDEFREWRLDESYNVPLADIECGEALERIPRDRQVITLCGTGLRSLRAARLLCDNGFNARSLSGGLVAWNKTYDATTVFREKQDGLRVFQIRRLGKGCVSYIVGCQNECVIVDPSAQIEEYLSIAQRERLKISSVMDTHQHADHVSGARLLSRAAGAQLLLNPLDQYRFDGFSELSDQKVISLGDGSHSMKTLHTPGHTPGSVSLMIDERFLLTGDTLFPNGLARPDLRGSLPDLLQSLYQTYRTKLLALPEDLLILPGHVGQALSSRLGVPFGESLREIVRRFPILRGQEKEFVDYVMANLPPKPPSFEAILRINNGEDLLDPSVLDLLEEGPNNCVLKTGQ